MSPRQIKARVMPPAVRTTPKAAPHRRNRADSRTLTVSTALDATTGDGLAANVRPRQEPTVFKNAQARAAAREARLLRTGRRHDPEDPDGRSSQMRSVLRRLPQPRSKR